MRDALSLLDQAIAHGSGKVEEAQVREMLGSVDLDQIFSILDALLAGDPVALLRVSDEMAERSLSFDAALQEMASLFTRLQIAQLAPQAIADEMPERQRILDLAAELDPEFVQLAYQIAVHGRQELPLAPDEEAGFIMTLLRLYAFRPVLDEASGGQPPSVAPTVGPGAATHARQAAPLSSTAPSGRHTEGASVVAPLAEARLDTAAAAAAAAAAPVAAERPADDWHLILAQIKVSGMARELGQHCELRDLDGSRMVLRLAPRHRHLLIKAAQDKLQQALAEHFGQPLRLAIEIDQVSGDTPAATAQRERRERMDRAIASVEQDGFVREVIEMFDATLIESSIKPV